MPWRGPIKCAREAFGSERRFVDSAIVVIDTLFAMSSCERKVIVGALVSRVGRRGGKTVTQRFRQAWTVWREVVDRAARSAVADAHVPSVPSARRQPYFEPDV